MADTTTYKPAPLTRDQDLIGLGLAIAKKGVVAKTISLDANGDYTVQGGGWIKSGEFGLIQGATFADVADQIASLPTNAAAILGIPSDLTKLAFKTSAEGEVARTLEHVDVMLGRGLVMFDIDRGGRSLSENIELIEKIEPGFAEAGMIATPSSKSFIYDSTGAEVIGEGNWHIFAGFEARDEADLKRLAYHLRMREWLIGTAYFTLSNPNNATGTRSILERGVIDYAVMSPERLIFEAPPILRSGLTRKAPAPFVREGGFASMASIVALTKEELQQAEANRREARKVVIEERLSVQADAEMATDPGLTRTQAVKRAKLRLDDSDRGYLPTDYVVHFADGTTKAIYDLDASDSKRRCDAPGDEGTDAGRSAAIVIVGKGGVRIRSFAHGGQYFSVAPSTGAPGEKISADIVIGDYGTDSISQLLQEQIGLVTGHPAEDWISVRGEMYRWVGTHYEFYDPDLLKADIARCLKFVLRRDDKGKLTRPFFTPANVTACYDMITTMYYVDPSVVGQAGLNFANGVLQISYTTSGPEFKCVPHSRDMHFIGVSPVSYDPDADTTAAETLLQAVRSDQLETFLRHLSCGFDVENANLRLGRPMAGIMEGSGSNGKDSIGALFPLIFGKIGSYTFEDFAQYDAGRRFGLSSMWRYNMSFSGESGHNFKLENLTTLKGVISMTGAIQLERKGIDAVEYSPKIALWFALNKAPITDGNQEAIRSRYAIYQFDKTYSSNPTKANELQADSRYAYDVDFRVNDVAPGFLVLLIAAYKRMWAEGTIDRTVTSDGLRRWAERTNTLLQWGAEIGLVEDPHGTVPVGSLFSMLTDWYLANNYAHEDGGVVRYDRDPSPFDKLIKRERDLGARLASIYSDLEIIKDNTRSGKYAGARGKYYVSGLSVVTPDLGEPDPEPEEEPNEYEFEFEFEFEQEA